MDASPRLIVLRAESFKKEALSTAHREIADDPCSSVRKHVPFIHDGTTFPRVSQLHLLLAWMTLVNPLTDGVNLMLGPVA